MHFLWFLGLTLAVAPPLAQEELCKCGKYEGFFCGARVNTSFDRDGSYYLRGTCIANAMYYCNGNDASEATFNQDCGDEECVQAADLGDECKLDNTKSQPE